MGLNYNPTIVSDGLVMYFDPANSRSSAGSGNTIYDLSGNSNTCTFSATPIYDVASNGNLILAGYGTVPHTSTLWNGNQFTYSIWAKKIGTGSAGERGIMIAKDTNYIDHGYNNFTLASFYTSTSQPLIFGNAQASRNEWRHYASTYDGTLACLYENGALTGTTSFTGPLTSTSTPLNIGQWNGGGTNFNGKLGTIMTYNRALSAQEVKQNYDATKSRYISSPNIVTSGLILNYNMSDYRSAPFTGNYIYDLSGSGNTGELLNGPTFSSINDGTLLFDGSNDLISLGTRPNIDGYQLPITLSGWFYLNSLSGNKSILGIYNGVSTIYNYLRIDSATFRFFLSIDGVLYPGINQGQYQYFDYSTQLLASRWYNFAVVVGGTLTSPTLTMYINAVSQTFSPVNLKSSVTLNQDYRIGANQFNSEFFNGYIAQVQIYNRTLSATEIQQNYNATKGRFGL
jgi:hypothetical protein